MNHIKVLQEKILRVIITFSDILFSDLYKYFQKILMQIIVLEDNVKVDYKYSLFCLCLFPLIESGLIEYGIFDGKTMLYIPNSTKVFFDRDIINIQYVDKDKRELHQTGACLLHSLPSLHTYIEGLEKSDIDRNKLKVSFDAYTLRKEQRDKTIGIYKEKDYSYYQFFLKDSDCIRKIKRQSQSLECMNYVRSYCCMQNNKIFYSYEKNDEMLLIDNVHILPPLLVRALCMLDGKIFKDDKFYINEKNMFKISEREFKQFERIMRG